METFNFQFYVPTHKYPEGVQVQFGRGYSYASEPQLPLQRRFILNFNGLRWFKNGQGVWSSSPSPTMNILALDEFYARHRMDKRFILPHEVFGNLVVRFAAPFEMPMGRQGGSGLTEPFQLQMLEHP